MKHIKDLAGQTMIYGLSSIVSRLLNYLLTPLIVYVFTNPADFGTVTILYAFAAFFNIILTYGMETGFFFFSKKETDYSKVYGTAFLSILATTTLFILFSVFFLNEISTLLDFEANKRYILWFILILAFDSLSALPFARLRQQNKELKFGLYKLLNVFISIFFTVLFIVIIPNYFVVNQQFLGFPFRLDVELLFIANLLASGITFIMFIPDLFRQKISFQFSLWKQMIVYSSPLLFAGLTGIINETLDRILLKIYIPSHLDANTQIGIYGACIKIAVLMSLFTQMFRFAAEPFFFNKNSNVDQRTVLADVSKYFFIYGLLIFAGVLFYLDIFQFFISKNYREGLSVVWIYMLGCFGLGVYFNLSFWYKLNGKTYFGLIIAAIGAVITVVLNILWIPMYSYMGSAWAHAVCYAIMILISYFLGQKYYPINYQLKQIALYFVITMVVTYLCVNFKFPNLFIDLFKNTIVFALLVYYFETQEQILSIFFRKYESKNS